MDAKVDCKLADELLDLSGGQSYCICAFYTPNYLPQIVSLKASAEALGLNYYFRRYSPAGGWEANTRLKASFIAHALRRLPKHNIAYLDADSVLRQTPELFADPVADVTILFDRRRRGKLEMLRIAAGTLLIRNTVGGRTFVDRWAEEASKAAAMDVDEDLIYRIFPTLRGVTLAVLPRSYYKIFDAAGVEPVIEHFQASRAQFKWRKALRQWRQIGTIFGAIGLAGLLWWLSAHMSVNWH